MYEWGMDEYKVLDLNIFSLLSASAPLGCLI